MQQRYCEDGLRLDTNYFEKTRIWVSAEADKRVAIGVSQGVGSRSGMNSHGAPMMQSSAMNWRCASTWNT